MGADILDSTNQNTFTFGRLKEEGTWFELDRIQRQHFESVKLFNEYLREEYHAIHTVLWKSGSSPLYDDLPARYRFLQTWAAYSGLWYLVPLESGLGYPYLCRFQSPD